LKLGASAGHERFARGTALRYQRRQIRIPEVIA